jgi:hypothetical protein
VQRRRVMGGIPWRPSDGQSHGILETYRGDRRPMRMLRTDIPGEVVKKIWRTDNRRCILVVRNGSRFTFIEDATDEGVTYDTWPDLLDGGWYDSAEAAEVDARKIVPWATGTSS